MRDEDERVVDRKTRIRVRIARLAWRHRMNQLGYEVL